MTRGFDLMTYSEVGRAAHTKDAHGQPRHANIFKRPDTHGNRDYILSEDATPPDGFRYVGTLQELRDESFYE